MDKAILNDRVISAYEISLNYENEKVVRAHSRNKKILCVDPHCQNPVLRYCHGDKKMAYFAHLTNAECDYDKFDKSDNALFKELRRKLFNHFSILGYQVEIESKLLSHHYSPIVCHKGNEFFVIEMGDSKTTMGYVERILKEYSLKNISVKWLVVGEEPLMLKENGVSFLKRFLLNESKNNDFILVKGDVIIQYRLDKKDYKLSGYQEIYSEQSILKNLCIADGELSITGFNSRYELWQNRKETAIAQELARREEQRKEQERRMLTQRQVEQERVAQFATAQKKSTVVKMKPSFDSVSTVTYETTMYTCTECGKKAGDGEFYMTQGNKGTCWECHYGPERYKEIKKHRGW